MRASGTTAIVTGAASGLGLATVAHLVSLGAHVVLVDLPGSDGAKVAQTLGSSVRFFPGDVTDPVGLASAFDVADGWPPPRIAVNCAGITSPVKSLNSDPEGALATFRRVVEVNLIGTFNLVQHAATAIARLDPVGEERGVIVTTASIAAFDGTNAPYAASKGGVASLTLPAARELAASKIRVVSVAPGIFETPMLLNGTSTEGLEALVGSVPHPRRLGRPIEFAQFVAHVIENPMINGGVVRVDAGLRI